jgi:hypothetical protein
MVSGVKEVWSEVADKIIESASKTSRNIKDEYILSQANNFYLRNVITEIQAINAPPHLKQGLPEGFEEFVSCILEPATLAIKSCISSVNISLDENIYGDRPLESKCLILGEADLVVGDLMIEIKCGIHKNPIELREAGSCKNLIQVLSYVALGRHGVLPLECKKAAIINPISGSWEIYDIDSWSMEDSMEFMDTLEELRKRV